MVLQVQGLSISYGKRAVVDGFALDVGEGECVALMGPSGTGKTSILDCIVGLQVPQSGVVTIGGDVMTVGDPTRRAHLRRTLIGVAYQIAALLPELSVEENVAITLLFDGVDRERALKLARGSLRSVGLDGHVKKRVDEVSGGEAQRIALARALVRPSAVLLVADEPTANLDSRNAILMGELILRSTRHRGMAALLATHDDRVAALCDRVINVRTEAMA